MCLSGIPALDALLGKADGLRLVKSLSDVGIEFVVIGGVALAYHGIRNPLEVDDLDLLFEPTRTTAEKLAPAVSALLSPQTITANSIRPGSKVTFRSPSPFHADLIFAEEAEGTPWIISDAVVVSVGQVQLRLASIEHLKTMKERVVKAFRDELKLLEGIHKEFEDKLRKHERDLNALQAVKSQCWSTSGQG